MAALLSACADKDAPDPAICPTSLSYDLDVDVKNATDKALNSWRMCIRKEAYLLHRSKEKLETLADVVPFACRSEIRDAATLWAKREKLSEEEGLQALDRGSYDAAFYNLARARAGNCPPLVAKRK